VGRRVGRRAVGAFGARRCVVLLACVGVALTLGVVAVSAASVPSFGAPKSYPAGRYPISVAMGDLNGDGRVDLAVANSTGVSVFMNAGKGRFRAKRDYAAGRAGSGSIAIGDVNGDGKPDLVTANGASVSVLINRGDGSFLPKPDYPAGPTAISVAIGDLNGDGKPDLVTANDMAGISVLLNTGDGSFAPERDYATGLSALSVAIADLNGDHKPDVGTPSVVLFNAGDGSFATKRATGIDGLSVALGDLNGDGRLDLATANFQGTVSTVLNRGDGSFGDRRDHETEDRAYSVAIGDLNGDRKPDLVSTDSLGPDEGCDRANGVGSTVTVHANRGDGRFGPERVYGTGCDPTSVAIGDLNGDRKPDLAIANNGSNTVSILLNATGHCVVPNVWDLGLAAAKRELLRENCRVGTILRANSKTVGRGRVISDKPKPGTVLPKGGRVNLLVSRGRKH
jgi:VCBS repeat protein/PASTA domain-containing protein/FG-GAP repeat protein